MENEEETEQEYQCVSCGRWVEEHEMIGEICVYCHVTVMEDEDQL